MEWTVAMRTGDLSFAGEAALLHTADMLIRIRTYLEHLSKGE
jgi:hypothetical protein